MPCLEMQELESSSNRFNEQSLTTISLLSAGRHEFSRWHRAGRARIAYLMQMHRQTCKDCKV
jgi:hypothetical protein